MIAWIAVLAFSVAVSFLGGCKTEERPEPVVERFLRAFNEKDLNVMLTCVDPKQERMFRASFRLIEKFTGGRLPVEDLMDLVPGLYQLLQDKLSADLNLRDIQVYRATINGEEAEVPVVLTAVERSAGTQREEKRQVRFAVRQFEEGWRIVGIKQR